MTWFLLWVSALSKERFVSRSNIKTTDSYRYRKNRRITASLTRSAAFLLALHIFMKMTDFLIYKPKYNLGLKVLTNERFWESPLSIKGFQFKPEQEIAWRPEFKKNSKICNFWTIGPSSMVLTSVDSSQQVLSDCLLQIFLLSSAYQQIIPQKHQKN
jgi:hypothetical protein